MQLNACKQQLQSHTNHSIKITKWNPNKKRETEGNELWREWREGLRGEIPWTLDCCPSWKNAETKGSQQNFVSCATKKRTRKVQILDPAISLFFRVFEGCARELPQNFSGNVVFFFFYCDSMLLMGHNGHWLKDFRTISNFQCRLSKIIIPSRLPMFLSISVLVPFSFFARTKRGHGLLNWKT